MKKILFLLLILILLVLVSGITGCNTQKTTPKVESAGLDVSFVKDAPPTNIVVNQEFPMVLNVQNLGGNWISKGEAKFYLTGLSTDFENFKSSAVNERMLDKESVYPDRIEFAKQAKFTRALQKMTIVPFAVTVCYNYGTSAQADVCVSASNESLICKIDGEKITSDSNTVAPVQITSLIEEVIGNKLRVSFIITNKLNGQVYLPNTDCDKLQLKDFNEVSKKDKVSLRVDSAEGFLCKLQSAESLYTTVDSLRGVAELGKVICEKKLVSSDEHVSPFSISLNYKYVSSITKNLNIVP